MSSILQKYPDYEVNIGIEVHVQLTTNTKIFCRCANEIAKQPNLNICQICTGQPGVLPVFNEKVIEYAVTAGLATNCEITPICEFARKHYFYPDLPKNYQITQHTDPICTEGKVFINLEDGSKKAIRLTRIHIEEDAGKNIHSPLSNESFVDYNRAGTPLLEMVSYPDISSSYEAREYLKKLRLIVLYLDISTGNMEEGAFRADTNISVRKKGAEKLGTKCELKNINSFKFISDAIDYEIERQIDLVESGQKVIQETRLWDEKNKKTILMRTKEEAADYRYFQDPDLPILKVEQNFIDVILKKLPELPDQKIERLMQQNSLNAYEANILLEDVQLCKYYEKTVALCKSKHVINWILREVLGYLKENKIDLLDFKVTPEKLAELINALESGVINNAIAKEVFELIAQTGQKPLDVIKEKGLEQIGSVDELEMIIKEIINENSKQVEQYKSGKDKLFGFFFGEAMKRTKGRAKTDVIQNLLKKHLNN